ncbi:MAG: hypothetical protein JO288_04535 [Hyphomicrobiales bacterium]|nr:hypothetical protein [Hyphomicrobiales bacterium]
MTIKTITGHNGKTFKLGRRRPLAHGPRLRFGHFLRADAPPPPPAVANYVKSGSAPIQDAMGDILGNDDFGDCTCAAVGHCLDVLRANNNSAKKWRPATRADALEFYSRVTDPSFDPETGANDNGADEVTVLNIWQKQGFFADGSGKIAAWAQVDPSNETEVKQAIFLNGNVYFGVPLPDRWVNPMPRISGFTWDVAGDADPDNGHAFYGYGYSAKGVLIDTWGMSGTITWPALKAYCDPHVGGGLYTVFGPDWISSVTQKSPSGFDTARLETYLGLLFA